MTRVIQVIPIVVPIIDWDNYLTLSKQVLGRSVCDGLDAINIEVRNLPGFIGTLGEIENKGSNPRSVIRDGGFVLEHLSFSFIVITTDEIMYELIRKSNLAFTISKTTKDNYFFAVVSGSLKKWVETIVSFSIQNMRTEFRFFANQLLKIFETNKLGELFHNYDKINMPDQTFRLVRKNGVT